MSPNAEAALHRLLAPESGASDNERAVARRALLSSSASSGKSLEPANSIGIHAPDRPTGSRLFLDEAEAVALDTAAGFIPSPDQAEALVKLLATFTAAGEATLTGSAGAGKSSLMKALLRRLTPAWSVMLLAPTWRAANRLTEVAGRRAISIHTAIYGSPAQTRQCPSCNTFCNELMQGIAAKEKVSQDGVELEVDVLRYSCPCGFCTLNPFGLPQQLAFKEPKSAMDDVLPYRLVVVDESSMIGGQVAFDVRARLLNSTTRLLWLGDANQLPPVEKGGQDLDPCNLLKPTATLTRIHRQAAGNPILSLAHTLLTVPHASKSGPEDWPFPRYSAAPEVSIASRVSLDIPAQWAAGQRHAGRDSAVIALSNLTRAKLNMLIRGYSHAENAGRKEGTRMIRGDRLLVRSNSGGLVNGELWEVGRVERVSGALLSAAGRADTGHRDFEADSVIGRFSLSLWRMALRLVGSPEPVWKKAHLVLPLGQDNLPVFESDVILWAGSDGQRARDLFRNIAYYWKREYTALLRQHEDEWSSHRDRALRLRQGIAFATAAIDAGNEKALARSLEKVVKYAVDGRGEQDRRVIDCIVALVQGDKEAALALLSRFIHPKDVAADVDTCIDFCVRVYGAIDPDTVIVADWGECLTCHAMQGSQAKNVGIVVDGPVWGMWHHDRVAALKWFYTAVTRAEEQLNIFSIVKGG